ncbi:MAG: hypothetical protein V8R08_01015 [Coriobacteriales bacterium]
MKSKALKTTVRMLIIVAICIIVPLALFFSCGGSVEQIKEDKYLSVDAAYAVPADSNNNTYDVYVFCTLKGDENKNINMGADQAELHFESNKYHDFYSLNKKRNDSYIKDNTPYSGVTDGSHGTIFASSDRTEKIAFVFQVGSKDLSDSKDATLQWVSYRATLPISEIHKVDSVDQMIESLSNIS